MTEALHSPEQKLSGALKGIPPDQYGPAYADHVLEIYKSYLEMADRMSSRREKANSFFLAVNAALIALLANGRLVGSDVTPRTLELLVPISAGILCYLWYRIIRSYRDLNSAKFKVIRRSCFSSSCLPSRLGNRYGLVPFTSVRAPACHIRCGSPRPSPPYSCALTSPGLPTP